ncbi:MAG: protoporphyrinogen oxidase HemJ [Arenicella sp.]|nr:protoporphyrinogen oxidase HemJ [Arenicella sp.]
MLWIKALHIIAVICWMAGIFYLPRLFVYHAMAEDEVSRERFKVMERKLYRGIMEPASIATLVFGIWLWLGYGFQGSWLNLKLGLVVLLLIYHFWCGYMVRRFARDEVTHGHVFFRFANELPVLLLVGIVILVVVKPF